MFGQISSRVALGRNVSPLLANIPISNTKIGECRTFSLTSSNHMPPNVKGSVKKRYLRKYPLIKTLKDGTVEVEGVSNKYHPCPVNWVEPTKVQRWMPGEYSSGDMGDLVSLTKEGSVDYSQPRIEYRKNAALQDAPPELKRVSLRNSKILSIL